MADYFVSDVHLRFDQPERGERFARFVQTLEPEDTLTIGGDLCDFWLASRQRRWNPERCPGLSSLIQYRSRGGRIHLLVGNHDAWMAPEYRAWLGSDVVEEPFQKTSHGVRVEVVHGHLLGARKPWKAVMEGQAFLWGFQSLPDPMARGFERVLRQVNERNLERTHQRHLAVYRAHAESRVGQADLFLFGHVHETFDEPCGSARLIVMGDWLKRQSYVKVDEAGVHFVVEPAQAVDIEAPPLASS